MQSATATKQIQDIRKRRLRHLDPRPIEILLQARIELGQAPVLEIRDALLLVPDVAAGAELVGGHFGRGAGGAWAWLAADRGGADHRGWTRESEMDD